MGASHPDTLIFKKGCAELLLAQGKQAEAEPLLREVLQGLKAKLPADSSDVLQTKYDLAVLYQSTGKPDAAAALCRECLPGYEKRTDDWRRFDLKAMLGGCLLAEKKYAEAEPLLREGCAGLRQRGDRLPVYAKARLAESQGRLVQLYEATGKKDEAAKWRQELAAVRGGGKPAKP